MDAGSQKALESAVPSDSVLTQQQRDAVASILRRAREISGLCFGVYVGPLPAGRDSAVGEHAKLPDPLAGVLVAVDPQAQAVEIVTGIDASRVLDNRSCELGVLTMASCFAAGDLMAGLRDGVVLLAEQARTPRVWHMDDPD